MDKLLGMTTFAAKLHGELVRMNLVVSIWYTVAEIRFRYIAVIYELGRRTVLDIIYKGVKSGIYYIEKKKSYNTSSITTISLL